MNFSIEFRLAALGIAAGLAGALIVFIMLFSDRQGEELHTHLVQLDSESAGIGEHFKFSLREVNDKMLRYQTVHDAASWNEFLTVSHELEVWIDAQKTTLKTQNETDILQQIGVTYADYLRSAQMLHDEIQLPDAQSTLPAGSKNPQIKASRRLFDLGQDLAQAHFNLRNELLTHVNQILTRLRQMILVLLGLLFLFGIALAALVYRDMIRPLRIRLVESEALAGRHEKLASLGMLAAGVAHEIRNPLTAIKAALFIQKKELQAGSPPHRNVANVEVVEREISRLEKIVNDFLQFARPADPELVTVPAELLLREVQVFFAPQLEKNNIKLSLEPNEPMQIRVDVAQCKQVLINLIQNAADSIGRGGKIILRARADQKRLAGEEISIVILEVDDSGKGIPPEVEERLFDPFFTTKETGTGLGLSIAARIVQKHGGELQYQTQVNHGTTFGIILPRVNE